MILSSHSSCALVVLCVSFEWDYEYLWFACCFNWLFKCWTGLTHTKPINRFSSHLRFHTMECTSSTQWTRTKNQFSLDFSVVFMSICALLIYCHRAWFFDFYLWGWPEIHLQCNEEKKVCRKWTSRCLFTKGNNNNSMKK